MRKNAEIETLKRIVNKVRIRRIALGISQQTLAELADCHLNSIGQFERGKMDITLSFLGRISKALSLPISDLLKDVDEQTTNL